MRILCFFPHVSEEYKEALHLCSTLDIPLYSEPALQGKGIGEQIKVALCYAVSERYDGLIVFDGVPDIADLQCLVAAVEAESDALWLTVRRRPGGLFERLKNYFWLYVQNFWVRVYTGQTLDDVQHGLRAYPVSAIATLSVRGTDADYEQEVLLKAAWNGVQLRELPIGQQASLPRRGGKHFWQITAVHLRAFFHRFISPFAGAPVPGNSFAEKLEALVVHELQANTSPVRAAASLAWGVFFGIFPIHGFQVACLMVFSTKFKLNRPLAFLGVNVSIPPLMPFLIFGAVKFGALVSGHETRVQFGEADLSTVLVQHFIDFMVGSALLAPIAAISFFLLTLPLFSAIERKR